MSTHSDQGRAGRAAERAAALELDAAVVSSLVNIRYLTGFTGSNGLLLVTARGAATLLTDPRYTIQAKAETAGSGVKVVISKVSVEEALIARLGKLKRIGFKTTGYSTKPGNTCSGICRWGRACIRSVTV